jgi:hypothetical protein
MKLISSEEALNFLSQAAPRAWVHRMLRWLAFDEGLPVFSSRGTVQPFTAVRSIQLGLHRKAGELSRPKMEKSYESNTSRVLLRRLSVGQFTRAR